MRAPRVTGHTSIRYSAVIGWPLDFCLHRHPVSVNCLYHARMVLSVDGSFAYFAQNARCTVTTDLLVWYSDKQNDFSPGAAIFSLHTLASPSNRNVNYDEKQLTGTKKCLSCSFYLYRFHKYVSYGFPIINFCNLRVHYETPCIFQTSAPCLRKTDKAQHRVTQNFKEKYMWPNILLLLKELKESYHFMISSCLTTWYKSTCYIQAF
jgi:hypothetical protein